MNGFQLTMPAEWRNLRPGDEGWITLYGQSGSQTEKRVIAGELKDFAVPLAPRGIDTLVNLAVYIDPVREMNLADEAVRYAAQLERERSATDIQEHYFRLPAGDALLLTARYPFGHGFDIEMKLSVFMVYHDGARYSLVFTSQDAYADEFRPVLECMATSLTFIGPAPTEIPSTAAD